MKRLDGRTKSPSNFDYKSLFKKVTLIEEGAGREVLKNGVSPNPDLSLEEGSRASTVGSGGTSRRVVSTIERTKEELRVLSRKRFRTVRTSRPSLQVNRSYCSSPNRAMQISPTMNQHGLVIRVHRST